MRWQNHRLTPFQGLPALQGLQARRVPWVVAAALCAVFLAGCASTPTTPDWVDGPSGQYPAAEFLTGRGSGPSVEQAQERARADLVKVFEMKLAVSGEDVQTYARDGEASRSAARVEQRISSSTDKVVSGVRVAELWRHPQSGEQHALAVLPRLQAANGLRQEIGRLDDAVARAIGQSRAAGDSLLQAGAAQRALDLAVQREEVQRSLRVVDITGRGVEAPVSAARLKADLDELLQRVRVTARAETDSSALEFPGILRGALAHAGFLAAGEQAEYVLTGRLRVDDQGRQDGWYWRRGLIEVSLTEAASGRVRGSRTWTVKASGVEPETVRVRLLREVETVLKRDLRGTLTGFAG